MQTRWEIALTGIDGTARLVAYTARRTKSCIGANFDARRAAILPFIDVTAAAWDRARMTYASPTWRFGFTGRTEIVAKQAGELPSLPEG